MMVILALHFTYIFQLAKPSLNQTDSLAKKDICNKLYQENISNKLKNQSIKWMNICKFQKQNFTFFECIESKGMEIIGITTTFVKDQLLFNYIKPLYSHMKSQYKKIFVQKLERREQVETYIPQKQQLIQHMNGQFQWSNCPVLCYLDSGISQARTVSQSSMFRQNHFFNAFLYAYTQHGDIVLVPDEIWIMISFYLSTYIDKHAEKLRSKIVPHSGVTTLTVVERADSIQQTVEKEKEWDYFFDEIIQLIEKQTLKGIVPALACDFSTTTKTYKVISTAIIMNSFKKFFNYHRMFAGCGINNIYMAGNRQDWAKMIPKLQNLIQFDINGQLKKYISHMKVILNNFLDTFDEKPDVAWWNTVMTTPDKRQIYGGEQIQIEGWILNFLGLYEKHTFAGFPQFAIKVPIKLINALNNTEKSLLLVSDFVSVSKLNDRTYKPDVGLSIFTVRVGPSRIEKVEKEIKAFKQKKKINYEYHKLNKVSIGIPQVLSPQSETKTQKSRARTVGKPLSLHQNQINKKKF